MDNHADNKKIIKEMMRLAFSAGTAHGLAAGLQANAAAKAGKTLEEIDIVIHTAEKKALQELFTHFKF